MHASPLAALVVSTPRGFEVNHLPMLLEAGPDGAAILRGHVSRANALWRDALEPVAAVAIFQAAEGYVSPTWYPAKAEHGRVVPTWNYQVVHAHGTLRAVDDVEWLRAFVTRLTERHEGGRAPAWQVSDAPADYLESQLRGIVGLELAVARLEGKSKLSQNRSAADRESVATQLERAGGQAAELGRAVRDAMREPPSR